MPPHNENPATALSGTGLPEVFSFGGDEHRQDSSAGSKAQGSWDQSRTLEGRSLAYARAALMQRGQDRIQQLALASALGTAARDAALIARAMS
jgi:hypothetical protein